MALLDLILPLFYLIGTSWSLLMAVELKLMLEKAINFSVTSWSCLKELHVISVSFKQDSYWIIIQVELWKHWITLQWHYQGGNDWGCDPDGTCCVGCGDQETFWGCSDIAITKGDDPGHSTPDAPTHSTPVEPTHTTPDHQPTTTAEVTTEPAPKTTEGPIDPNDCHSIPPYNVESDMDLWCKQNCAVGNCPSNMCDCAKWDPTVTTLICMNSMQIAKLFVIKFC